MKKIYKHPAIKIVKLDLPSIICGSGDDITTIEYDEYGNPVIEDGYIIAE